MVKTHKNIKRYFSKQDLQEIEDQVAATEKVTSGEIVPVIAMHSVDQAKLFFIFSGIGWFLAFVCSVLILAKYPYFDFSQLLTGQIFIVIALLCLGTFREVQRLALGQKFFAKAVHSQAMIEFVRNGVSNTKDHTGVLLYISIHERMVYILADSGIHKKLGQHFWDAEVSAIAQGFKDKSPTAAICKSIESMGQKIAANFPIQENDRDELSNKVILRD